MPEIRIGAPVNSSGCWASRGCRPSNNSERYPWGRTAGGWSSAKAATPSLVRVRDTEGAFFPLAAGAKGTFDVPATGSYTMVWWIGVGVGAFSAIVHLPIRERAMAPLAV